MRIKSELRNDDIKNSNIVTNFLIDNFYSKFCTSYTIVTDTENQFKGIDSIFSLNDIQYFCDEKSAIRYINRHLQTFALELSFLNRAGCLNEGWFVNDREQNNSFLFVWIDKANVNIKNLVESSNDLKDVEIALVMKDKLQEYLDNLGWCKKNLRRKCERILNNEFEPLWSTEQSDVKFTYSKQLVEKPINILIKRNKLIEISDFTIKFNEN